MTLSLKPHLQSIYFLKSEWNTSSATKWLNKNNLKQIKRVHNIGNELRYNTSEPIYKHYKTEKMVVHGTRDKKGNLYGRTVFLVIGYL